MNSDAPRGRRIFRWFDRRTGLDALLREALDEPIPGGARFAYVFGSALLFIFISQVITGIFLALYYVPSSDHAHTTVAYITKAVYGRLLPEKHSRLRPERDGHPAAASCHANVSLWLV
jgi:ubiquinol-cytochrome c reductase cytochrome b subunit